MLGGSIKPFLKVFLDPLKEDVLYTKSSAFDFPSDY